MEEMIARIRHSVFLMGLMGLMGLMRLMGLTGVVLSSSWVSAEENRVLVSSTYDASKNLVKAITEENFKEAQRILDEESEKKTKTYNGEYVLTHLFDYARANPRLIDPLNRWCENKEASYAAHYLRGEWYMKERLKERWKGEEWKQNVENAREDFEKAYEMNPQSPYAAKGMIEVCTRVGAEIKETSSWFQKAIEVCPDYYHAYNAMMRALNRKGGEEMALSFIDQVVADHPEEPLFEALKINWYFNEREEQMKSPDSKETQEALRIAQWYMDKCPKSGYARNLMARVKWEHRARRGALKVIDQAVKIDPSMSNYTLRGRYRHFFQKNKEAEKDLLKAVELNPFNRDTLWQLGNLYTSLGNATEVIKYYGRYLELRPNNRSDIRYIRGWHYMMREGDPLKANNDFEQVVNGRSRYTKRAKRYARKCYEILKENQ